MSLETEIKNLTAAINNLCEAMPTEVTIEKVGEATVVGIEKFQTMEQEYEQKVKDFYAQVGIKELKPSITSSEQEV